MQINNNSNRMNAPQFGMAVKITRGGEKYLQKQGLDFLTRLEKAGEDMVDFKHFDLEVGENGLRVKSKQYANAYRDPELNVERNPHVYKSFNEVNVTPIYDGNSVTGPKGQRYPLCFVTPDNDAAVKLYDDFVKADYLDRNILLTKTLENSYNSKAAESAQKITENAKKQNFISNLMEKFGVAPKEI